VGGTTLVLGILLLIACCFLAYLVVRRVRLMRGGGVDVCLRRRPPHAAGRAVTKDASAGWHFGVGRYRGDELVWYRLTSLRLGPSTVLDRMDLEILDRRSLAEAEVYALPQADSVLQCRSGGADLEIAMAPGVLTGFLSWLEAAPPGRNPGYHQAS
jgi:Protein of unknown function (DUF2550)